MRRQREYADGRFLSSIDLKMYDGSIIDAKDMEFKIESSTGDGFFLAVYTGKRGRWQPKVFVENFDDIKIYKKSERAERAKVKVHRSSPGIIEIETPKYVAPPIDSKMVFALDMATKTGWAYCKNGEISSGVKVLGVAPESQGLRLYRFREFVKAKFEEADIKSGDLVIYEMAHHRGGYATQLCLGLVGIMMAECVSRSVDFTTVHSATLKKFSTGYGRSKKPEMVAAAKERHPEINILDDNHADALLIMGYGIEKYILNAQNM